MLAVLLQSMLFIIALAALCALIVKRKKMVPAALGDFLRRSFKNTSPASEASISVHQRRMLGWKTLVIDVGWHGNRYLLLLQEGHCTVVDRIPDSKGTPPADKAAEA